MLDPAPTPALAASPAPADTRRAQLAALLPEAFCEGRLDVAALRRALGDEAVIEGGERYALNWAGKADAWRVLQTPSTATLRPQREASVNFDDAQHVFIEGENLEVLKVLQKAYFGKVKLIYIDPPYNTGGDSFVYPDRFQESKEEYLRRIDALDDDGSLMREGAFRKNSRENGHYHSNWLSMMLPRLYLARNLLREDGVIFVSIDDNEVHNLRCLMNEVFGEENFVGNMVWQKGSKSSKLIGITHEYMLVFARDKTALQDAGIWRKRKEGVDEVLDAYRKLRKRHENNHKQIEMEMQAWYARLPKQDPRKAHAHYRYSDDRGLYFSDNFAGPDDGRTSRPRYPILHPITNEPCKMPSTGWRWDEKRTRKALALNPPLIHFGADHKTIPCRKSYLHVIDSGTLQSVFYKDGRAATLTVEALVGKGVFDFPKDVDILQDIINAVLYPKSEKSVSAEDAEQFTSLEPPHFDTIKADAATIATEKPDNIPIVLDFFAGSGSTAHAVLATNLAGSPCRFITVQLPEPTDRGGYDNVADISRERIRRVIQKIHENTDLASPSPENPGFKSFRLAPSNFRQWRGDGIDSAQQLAEQLKMFARSEKPGAQTDAVLHELLLKSGYTLTTRIESLDIAGMPVFAVDTRRLLLVLDAFDEAMIWPLVEMAPREIIVTERVFNGSDMLKSNLDLQCRDAGIRLTCV